MGKKIAYWLAYIAFLCSLVCGVLIYRGTDATWWAEATAVLLLLSLVTQLLRPLVLWLIPAPVEHVDVHPADMPHPARGLSELNEPVTNARGAHTAHRSVAPVREKGFIALWLLVGLGVLSLFASCFAANGWGWTKCALVFFLLAGLLAAWKYDQIRPVMGWIWDTATPFLWEHKLWVWIGISLVIATQNLAVGLVSLALAVITYANLWPTVGKAYKSAMTGKGALFAWSMTIATVCGLIYSVGPQGKMLELVGNGLGLSMFLAALGLVNLVRLHINSVHQ
jgi:hypothetical protein